jgi:hypothetical protein
MPTGKNLKIEGGSEEESISLGYSFTWFVAPILATCGGGALLIIGAGIIFWIPLAAAALVPLGYGAYIYFLWQATIYIILPDRIVYQHGIFLPEVDEIYFSDIRKRSKRIEVPGTDVGSILLETAAQSKNNANSLEGDIIIKNIENVSVIYDLITGLMSMARASSSKSELSKE